MMRGKILYAILNTLEDTAIGSSAFVGGFLKAGYGASLSKLEYEQRKISKKFDAHKIKRAERQEGKIRIQKYLWKLKKSGLITEKDQKLSLTKKGRDRLVSIKKSDYRNLEIEKSNNLVIISYDIPLYTGLTRNKLLEVLKILGFKMIHKSLWSGKIKISREILSYFEEIGALKYLEILEVTKHGTLEKVN